MHTSDRGDDEAEIALRALALQLAIQLPSDTGTALRLVGMLRDVVIWRAGSPSGREERTGKLHLVISRREDEMAG